MKAWIPLTLDFRTWHRRNTPRRLHLSPRPDAPPDGNTATKDQMIAAKHDFDRYNGEMNSYLDCLKLEMDAASAQGSLEADGRREEERRTISKRFWCRRTMPPSMSCRRCWALQ
jgi:hypothetical protein